MTKAIRVENADNSNFKVIVEVWQTNEKHLDDGTKVTLPSTLVTVHELAHPTALLSDYITSHRYLVVKEA